MHVNLSLVAILTFKIPSIDVKKTLKMDLFNLIAPEASLHPIFKLMLEEQYKPEREVILGWAEGFKDRDGKFPYEFQTTFESSMWELYLYAFLKEIGATIDFSYHAPDFVASLNRELCIEAVVASPALDNPPPVGHTFKDIPENLAEFNKLSTLRICNSLSAKIGKYRKSYSKFQYVQNKPFVIALASFDRPFSHLASSRAIMAALYGIYFDEEATIATGADEIVQFPIDAVIKSETTNIPVGYFIDDKYSDVSAVIYSSLATWGKIRALADNRNAMSTYITYHPSEDSLIPEIRKTRKCDYFEYLADGLHIFHNPFAKHPLNLSTFNHERIAQYFIAPNGQIDTIAPKDFLLLRHLNTLIYKDA